MTRTLTQEELNRYDRDGYLVITDAVPQDRLQAVIEETERMCAEAYKVTAGTDMLDLDPSHTPDIPRIRRIKSHHEHSDFFADFVSEPLIMDILAPLMPSGIRVHNTKINMKSARHRASPPERRRWGGRHAARKPEKGATSCH